VSYGILGDKPAQTQVRKDIPRSSNPLKSFNWSKLPDCKVEGTIWTEIDETRLYKALDLAEVDRLFSAYQKNGLLVSQSDTKLLAMHAGKIYTGRIYLQLSHSFIFLKKLLNTIYLCNMMIVNIGL